MNINRGDNDKAARKWWQKINPFQGKQARRAPKPKGESKPKGGIFIDLPDRPTPAVEPVEEGPSVRTTARRERRQAAAKKGHRRIAQASRVHNRPHKPRLRVRKRRRLAGLAALLLVCGVTASCATPIQLAASTVPITRPYRVIGKAHGSACVRLFLGFIPLGVSSSLHDAYREAKRQVPGTDGLIEVTVDRTWFEVPIPRILPLYHSACTEVRGKAIQWKRRRSKKATPKH